MPAQLVADEYSVRAGLKDAERLSVDAEVSIEAAANRLIALTDEPCVLLCLVWAHKPADRPALRRGTDIPKRLRVRYGVTKHLNLYVPSSRALRSLFCEAAEDDIALSDITTLPGRESAGFFRVEAKRYGADRLERVLVFGRPIVWRGTLWMAWLKTGSPSIPAS